MKDMINIKEDVRNYIIETSMMNEKDLHEDTQIFDAGILDSMGLLFLIEFLNEKFSIEVSDEELLPTNFESINSITKFIQQKI